MSDRFDVVRKALLALALVLVPVDASALVWPDVPEQVAHGLESQDPAARRTAAQQIKTLGASRGAPLVLKALSDPDVEVRLAAADSAVSLHVVQATDEVTAWLGDREVRLRIAACNVARAMPNERAVAPLARALGDSDPGVRAAAADALGAQNSPDAVAPLLGRLDDPTPAVRIQVARSLAKLGDDRAVVPLVGKVEDSVVEVRQAIAAALGELGDKRASQALILQLRDANIDVRIGALEALGRLRTPDAVDAIAPFVIDRNPSLRQAALTALGRIFGDDADGGMDRTAVRDALVTAGPTAVAPLTLLLDGSPAPQAASSAAWVLGELGARASTPRIVAAMRRGVLPPAAALHALAGAGASDAVPIVLEFVDDPSPLVRAEAARAADRLLDPGHPDGRAVEPLAAALRDPALHVSERATLTRLLGRTGAPRAAPILLSLLNAKDQALKIAAIDGLGALGPAGADGALVEQLGDPEAPVRLHAAVALADAGTAKARDLLLARMETSDEIDRTALLVALRGVLARAPSDAAIEKVRAALELAVGPERDALLSVLGRAGMPRALSILQGAARSEDPNDRRAAASALAGFAGAGPTVLALLADRDPSVRAQAAWSCGFVCGADALPKLAVLGAERDADIASNAAAAIGKIAARTTPRAATTLLCPKLDDPRAVVRIDALSGLAAAKGRCASGAERKLLASDSNEHVRRSAARMIAAASGKDDLAVLDHCVRSDRSGVVSAICRDAEGGVSKPTLPPRSVEVYIVPSAAQAPEPRAHYTLVLADGFTRSGLADRRGAVYEAFAPAGTIELLGGD